MKDMLKIDFEDYEFLDWRINPSKSLSFQIEGMESMVLVCDDPVLNLIADIFSHTFKRIHQEYSEKWCFFLPDICFKPCFEGSSSKIELKIWMLEKEVYEKILENRKNKKESGQDE